QKAHTGRMRGERQRLDEVHEGTGRFDFFQSYHCSAFFHSCHREVAALRPKNLLHFADSIGASEWCTGPSSGKARPPQDDNRLEHDMWLEDDRRQANSFVRKIL